MNKLKLIHGHGEITRIDKQIRDAFEYIDFIGLSSIWKDQHIQTLASMGFEHTSSTGDTFIGERQVIKHGYLVGKPLELKHRVPTLCYHYEEKDYLDDDMYLIIQPKVRIPTTIEQGTVVREFFKRLDDYYGVGNCDSHCGNVGMYYNKPRMFDW